MPLTPSQSTIFVTDVQSDPVLSLLPANGDSASTIALVYANPETPDWFVYHTALNRSIIQNAITYANMTPAQAIPATDLTIQTWIAKALLAQGKQFNLQNILMNSETINVSLPNIRAGLQDCLLQLPTTSTGTNQPAGWATLQPLLSRLANRLEKLLSTGTGTNATPATMSFEGILSYQDVAIALNWSI